MNVSLPKLAAPANAAKTLLPATGATSGKFSAVFADAQDTANPATTEVRNGGESHVPKKMSAKSDKSAAKPSAQPDFILPKDSPAAESKPVLTTTMLLSGPNAGQKEVPQPDDSDAPSDDLTAIGSDSDSQRAFQSKIAASGAVASGQPDPKKIDSTHTTLDSQPAVVSSTNSAGTWMGLEEDTNLKSTVTLPTAHTEPSATPNGKPATAGTKPVSGDSARGTTSALDTKAQTSFTLLPSHATSSAMSPSQAPPPGHVTQDAPRGQQEKSVASASSETTKTEAQKKESDGARNGATDPNKGASPSSSSTALSANSSSGADGGTTVVAAGPNLAVAMQISSPAPDSHSSSATVSPKTPDPLPHGQPTVAAEDAEAASEAAALSANSLLHTAKLVAGMEQSELRVGLRAGEFGNVDIRTSMIRNQFTAEISVERGELGRALAAELPSLQHRLTQQNLPAANITVQDHSSGRSSDFQQGSRHAQSASPVSVSGNRVREDSLLPLPSAETTEATARLDIHM